MKKPTNFDAARTWGSYVIAALLGASSLAGCIAQAPPEDASDKEESDDDDDDTEESSASKDSDDESEKPSETLSELPSPRACKAFAPKVAFKDTNPSSDSFGKELSPQDFKGKVSLWIPTFDCNC